MTTEISPLQRVQDNIRDRIKAEFTTLIPDDMWAGMVESVVKDFVTDKRKDSYGRDTNEPSPLKKMIREEIDALAKAAVKAELEKLAAGTWSEFGATAASEAVKKLVTEHFAAMLASVQMGMVDMAVGNAVNHIRNSMQR